MEELITAFGIDGRLIIIQIVNFIILVVALSYFLYRPIINLLNEREAKIKQAVKDAEAAKSAKESASAERDSMLTAANLDAEAVIDRAKAHADEKGTEIIRTAEKRADTLLEDAKLRASEIAKQAHKEAEAEIAQTAVLAAEKILRQKKLS